MGTQRRRRRGRRGNRCPERLTRRPAFLPGVRVVGAAFKTLAAVERMGFELTPFTAWPADRLDDPRKPPRPDLLERLKAVQDRCEIIVEFPYTIDLYELDPEETRPSSGPCSATGPSPLGREAAQPSGSAPLPWANRQDDRIWNLGDLAIAVAFTPPPFRGGGDGRGEGRRFRHRDPPRRVGRRPGRISSRSRSSVNCLGAPTRPPP